MRDSERKWVRLPIDCLDCRNRRQPYSIVHLASDAQGLTTLARAFTLLVAQ
jgi:hypothetical protein